MEAAIHCLNFEIIAGVIKVSGPFGLLDSFRIRDSRISLKVSRSVRDVAFFMTPHE